MPRKKRQELTDVTPTATEDISQSERQDQSQEFPVEIEELAKPDTEPETDQLQSPGETSEETLTEAHLRDFLGASVEVAIASVGQLLKTQAELQGADIADQVFDKFEGAFINRLEERLQPFTDVLIPQLQETSRELKQRSTARVERRLSAFNRLKQIASLVSDECQLSLPSGEPTGNLLGFASWEPVQVIETKEND
jgi:hypothetical protein